MSRAARLSVGAGEVALFASDMHLGDHDPDTAAQFLKVLDAQASSITHLFLLGDIFEAWVGDDQPDQVAAALAGCLKGLTDRGVRVALMRGNRDFLLGSGELFGEPVLLAHGDAWCTDDHAYQRFRAEVRSEAWQARFLSRPLAERLAIAREMRTQSERNKHEQDLGDVNDDVVRTALITAGVRRTIHGHTHRPGSYSLGEGLERWVLPDWLAASGRGGVLKVGTEGWEITLT